MDPVLRAGFDDSVGQATVLKIRLRPFTLGHWFLLQEIDSPFLNPLLPIERRDLVLAVLICSQLECKARANLLSWSTVWACRLIGLLNLGFDLDVECEKMHAYLAAGRSHPASRCSPGGKPRHSPEPWRLLVMLMRDFRMSRAEAMATTATQANCLWAVQAEIDGALELMPSDPFNAERLRMLREAANQQRSN